MPQSRTATVRTVPAAADPTVTQALNGASDLARAVAHGQTIDQVFDVEPDAPREPLEVMLANLGDLPSSYVNVYRRRPPPDNKRLEHVCCVGGDEFTTEADLLEQLRTEWGGGEYVFHLRKHGEPSNLKGNKRVWLAEPRKVQAPDPMAALSTLIQQQAQQQRDFQQQMLATLTATSTARPAATVDDDLSRVDKMASTLQKLMPPPPPPAPAPMGFGEMLGALNQMMSFANKLQPGTGATDSDLVLEGVRTLRQVLAQPQPRAAAPARPLPNPRPVPPAATTDPHTQPERVAPAAAMSAAAGGTDSAGDDAALRALLTVMHRAAQMGGDPTLYADMVLDQVGDEVAAQLLAQPDPVAALTQWDARVGQHAAWFDRVVEAMRDLLTQEDATDAIDASPAADAASAAVDDPGRA